MKNYLPKSTKTAKILILLNEALDILESVGIPVSSKTERGAEKMAEAFLAVAHVTGDWKMASDNTHLQTRQIISFINKHFEENISSGSYDDIRRKDLKMLVIADLIVNSGDKLSAATNDPTRGYALHPDFKNLVVQYKTKCWTQALTAFNAAKPSLADLLERKRNLEQIPVTLPDGKPLTLSLGEHNVLQKAIIEQFLPRFGGGDSQVLYIGDTSNKMLHIEETELTRLGFFKLSHYELPDIIAFSKAHNWLYLIEAVHSSGPMSEIRVHELKKLLKDCKAELIFVTAFLTRADFRKWVMNIAWETEVWIADNPDDLVHFNGHKFLGAY
jgi:type II restriction enzyme